MLPRVPMPMTRLSSSFSFMTSGVKSESPDMRTKVSSQGRVKAISIASTTRAMSARFFSAPLYDVSSAIVMPSSNMRCLNRAKRPQSP